MVDFGKLRRQLGHSSAIDPLEIFMRLPKAPGIDDLWNSQAEALRAWFDRRAEPDLVIKLNTGGGKTLVGLLIAQSALNELHDPVLYLSPNNLLVDQTLKKAKEYGIEAVRYVSGEDFDDRFLGGRCVMVATYAALFNGRSRFGITGGSKGFIQTSSILLDDAHAALTQMREQFTISIPREDNPELYQELTTQFRSDFGPVGQQGTFDDIVSGTEQAVLEVPYWAWLLRCEEVRQRLSTVWQDHFRFSWPLIRDYFNLCHVLISGREFAITPILPLIDMFPTFSNCPRRVYMSATVADDSSIIRVFNASKESIAKPIAPASLAGVGERMIIVPAFTSIPAEQSAGATRQLPKWVSDNYGGAVILTPSRGAADRWKGVAEAVSGDDVAEKVEELNNSTSTGPYVFPNRYDGIDLPGNSCRLLVLDGLPQGTHCYDLYKASALEGSSVINTTIAQRVEQGMGRGTRGAGDHCVVLLTGKDLVSWVSRSGNSQFLSSSTQAQLSMGIDISNNISGAKELEETILKCLERSKDWTEYHADALADSAAPTGNSTLSLDVAECERRFFRLTRDGNYEKAIGIVEKFVAENPSLQRQVKGWLLQLAARSASIWGNRAASERLQRDAYSFNRSMLRPRVPPPYVAVSAPTRQSENIIRLLKSFNPKIGLLAHFDEIVDWLVATASANQFEEAFKKFGTFLGFEAQRPEKDIGKGPDVLWLVSPTVGWVIEVKSKKDSITPLNKQEHGQLLEAYQWFHQEYPAMQGLKVVVHPNTQTTEKVSADDSYALIMDDIPRLVASARELLSELCYSPTSGDKLTGACERRLGELSLSSDKLILTYLRGFSSGKP